MKTFIYGVTVSSMCFLLGWSLSGDHDTPEKETSSPEQIGKSDTRDTRKRIKKRESSELPDIDACRALLAASQVKDARHPLLRKLDRMKALRRWLVLNPESAMKEAEANPTSEFTKDLFLTWVDLDSTDALKALKQTTTSLRRFVATDVFVAFFQKDARLASEELQSAIWMNKGASELGWSFHANVYHQWAMSDLQSAIKSLPQKNSNGEQYDGKLEHVAILKVWAKTDFQAAWTYLRPEGEKHNFSATWDAPKLLADGILAGSDGAEEILEKSIKGDLAKRLNYIAEAMVRIDPRAALDWSKTRAPDDPLRLQIVAHAAKKFATSDPERALNMISESGGSMQDYVKGGVLRESFASLAVLNPSKAVARVQELPENQREYAMAGYLTVMFGRDTESAIDQCQIWLNDPELKSQLPLAWANSLAWGRGAGARDLGPILEAMPALNDAVNGKVLSTWSKTNPRGAAQWIKQRLDNGHTVNLGSDGIVADLAIQVPGFTADWLTQLPDSQMRSNAANTLVANWAAFDADAARAWIESLPQGGLRSGAEHGFTRIEKSR